MNAFPAGTRVFYWNVGTGIEYGVVQSTDRLPDGTQLLVIQVENGKTISLPAASVTKVT